MKKRLTMYMLIFALLLSNLVFANNAQAASSLDATVQSTLGNSNISVTLRSLESGKVLYERNGDIGRKPASTMKLLTASAALDTLGPDYRFKTDLYIDGEVNNNVLNGNLYIKGGGDPTLNKKDFSTFAVALKRHGIRTINGNIYGDDTLFSGSQLSPGVVAEDETYYYGARTSALTMSPNDDYDSGTIIVNVKASSVGRPPTVTAEPNLSGMQVVNKAKTVGKGQKNTVKIVRKYRTNQIVITGSLPVGSSAKDWVSLQDPTINTLHSIKIALESTGLKFSKRSNVMRKVVPENATLLYTKSSIPLKTLMNPFLKLSNNSIADILVKTMGHEVYGKGHINYGLKVLNDYGNTLGLNMGNWNFEDGSGMSHNNRISTNELTSLLLKVRDEQNYNIFYNALPVGGQKDRLVGGSLKKRFTQAPYISKVHAKTGSITGVYTLAGYITAKSGRTFAFAIMTQNQSSSKISNIDTVVKKIYQLY